MVFSVRLYQHTDLLCTTYHLSVPESWRNRCNPNEQFAVSDHTKFTKGMGVYRLRHDVTVVWLAHLSPGSCLPYRSRTGARVQ